MKKGVDDRCYDLANHFLAELKGATATDVKELAETLQALCEDSCLEVEDREEKKVIEATQAALRGEGI